MKKTLIAIIAIVIICACAVGTTFAWLMDKTTTIKNTFTYGDIDITLAETTGTEYKMVPGQTVAKNPKVTVDKDSEACWLFIKIDKSTNFDDFMTYAVATGWTALAGNAGVYYREVTAGDLDGAPDTGLEFNVLNGNSVTVKDSVTKAMFNALDADGAVQPTLSFTAYAVQSAGVATASDAWTIIANS